MTKDAALTMALEFNKRFFSLNAVDVSANISVPRDEWRVLFKSIQTALAQTSDSVKQEPVGTFFVQHWRGLENQHFDADGHGLPDGEYKLYTAPPNREWVGLTDEEVDLTSAKFFPQDLLVFHSGMYVAQNILKERNT